jgi:C-terminal processing protease CtpA/Prc
MKRISFRGTIMRHERPIAAAATLLGAVIAANLAAQPVQPPQPAAPVQPVAPRAEAEAKRAEAQAQRAQAQADRENAQAERSNIERELAEARSEMEEAAREVARLSQQLAQPYIKNMTRQFRYRAQRSMLGIGIEDTERGVRVASVTPNGPAANAGLVVGDTIVEIEGARLADQRATGGSKQSPSDVFLGQMENVDDGEEIELRVVNESGAERNVKVMAREFSPWLFVNPSAAPNPNGGYSYSYNFRPGVWVFGQNPWSEMQLVTLTEGLGTYFGTSKGLLVVRAPTSSTLQLRDGDVILDIGGREPTSPEHAMRILGSFQEGETLKIAIMRDQRRQTLDVKMPSESPG